MGRSKFSGIIYPIFGIIHRPFLIRYRKNIINFQHYISSRYLVLDDSLLSGETYLERIFQLEDKYPDKRIHFDITCMNTQQLITSNIKWGIDNSGKIHNFSKKHKFLCRNATISRRRNNLIWMKGISYPFEIPEYLMKVDMKHIVAQLVYVDETWYFYKFSYQYSKDKYIRL